MGRKSNTTSSLNNIKPARKRIKRTRIQNAGFTGESGAYDDGDRGAYNFIPDYTGNPYDSTDFVYRWRQYTKLYETSWEARKIVRIPIEDALRKDWVAEGIDEEIAQKISNKLTKLKFNSILSRSLILERLLGGCLTFLGISSKKDEPEKPYKSIMGESLLFCNAIPISRINRMEWDTNPLSANYMRPSNYLINGYEVHSSRCLTWDGDPLFDPYDFALTNFRANLAGFGPSKLAPIWDDIVKAVGTRQAAYQLIQVNNAIIAAVEGLQDLNGTTPGKKALAQIKEIANNLSLYRAAIIDGQKISIQQQSASFGSIPELIITFIQILSAASDIPATRFIGQAPGGLNATGESDLENYYNVIDSLQRQKVEPALRRIYDIIGYNIDRHKWIIEREKLTFKFPPLWNQNELEEAQKVTAQIDNALKLRESNLLTDEQVIEELNIKKALSIKLDKTDSDIMGDLDGDNKPIDAEKEIAKLRMHNSKNIDPKELIKLAGGNPDEIDIKQFEKGMKVEIEHKDVTGGDPVMTAKIALAHLKELPDYYTRLTKMEKAKK